MNTELTDEARELEAVLDSALRKAGGFDLARTQQEGGASAGEVARLLESVGVWDLRPRRDDGDGEAAAAVCRAAGRYALPYPVAERLSGDPHGGIEALAVVGRPRPRINLAAVDLAWFASDGASQIAPVTSVASPVGGKLGAFVCPVERGPWRQAPGLAPLALTLPCWTLLGMVGAAFEMTRGHLLEREQFGRPLAKFQALQFRLADLAAAVQGFEELAKYTLWSVFSGRPGALVDALALRLAALETAETVFRDAHQLFGAMGFCDEVNLSWLSRYSQPYRRLPWGRSQTEANLLDAMADEPFTGLFDENAVLGAP
jgi:hypothetical protein